MRRFFTGLILFLIAGPALPWEELGPTSAHAKIHHPKKRDIAGVSGQVPVAGAVGEVPAPEMGLSAVIRTRATGLDSEWLNSSPSDAAPGANEFQRLRDQAAEFIRFRSKNKMSADAKLTWVANCLKAPQENPFCVQIKTEVAEPKALVELLQAEAVTPDLLSAKAALAKADLDVLKSAKETILNKALRSFASWEELEGVSKKVIDKENCAHATIAMTLGQKAEEFFPEERFKKLAKSLYGIAAQCPGDLVELSKARYRLSLMEIWDGRCEKAEPMLARLQEQKGGDYVSRSLYWRTRCAQQAGNKLHFQTLKSKLAREFPLNYHGLLLDGRKTPNIALGLDLKEPVVRFRSELVPSGNAQMRAAEMLQKLGAHDLALDLLDDLDERIRPAEPSFRLYAALLAQRSGDQIGHFRRLASLFREYPTVISRTTLKLFYPFRKDHADILRHFGSAVDPYLVAALIRQESGFNSHARSPAGALGLMQIMPATAKRMERVSRRELLDSKTNVRLGVRYFRALLDRFNGDAELALAAYNAGPERVVEWKRRYPTADRVLFLDLIPFRETREYVAYIARNYYWYMNLYAEPSRGPASFSTSKPDKASKSGRKPLLFSLFNTL